MEAIYTFNGTSTNVKVITQYPNGYFWIEKADGSDSVVHYTYITLNN